MNQNLGQFEFIDPGYGYEIAMADMGFGVSDFGWDPSAFYFGEDFGAVGSAYDWSIPGADPFAGAYPVQDVSQQSIQNIQSGTVYGPSGTVLDAQTGSVVGTVTGGATSGFNMNDVLGLMKTGLSFYQAFSQIQAKNEAISKGLAPGGSTQPAGTAPAGYTRLPDGSLRNNLTGQIIRPPGTPGAAGADLIPGVPNWALLAAGAGVALLLFSPGKGSGKRRRR